MSYVVKKSDWRKHLICLFVFTLLATIALLQSFQYHKKYDFDLWKNENFADAGGYFAYELMWFDYGYKSANYPEKLDSILGNGFTLESEIVRDKYTCGVAYLQTPFYLVNKKISKINGQGGKANSKNTRRAIDVAAIFYLWAGALCLYFFLVRFYQPFVSLISICLVIVGTNVFFYAVYHPGMSHIYSFFLFSIYLLLGDDFIRKKKKGILILLSVVAAVIVLIRPTDLLFLPGILFIRGSFKENFRLFLKPVHLIIACMAGILVFIPQMYYWHTYSGHFIYYSYSGEGFINILSPKFLSVLFAPYNGLFPYSLLLVVLIGANIYAAIKKYPFAIYFLIYQFIALYLIASWHIPTFGGGYGQRNYVEIFAGYPIILAYAINGIIVSRKRILLISVLSLSAITSCMNLKIISKYDHVFLGRSNWDWREYFYFLNFKSFSIEENFNKYYEPAYLIIDNRNNVLLNIQPENQYARTLLFDFKSLPPYFKHGLFSMDIRSEEKNIEFFYCLKLADGDSIIDNRMVAVSCKELMVNKWKKISGEFILNFVPNIPKESKIIIFIWNIQQQKFQVDNVKLCIE